MVNNSTYTKKVAEENEIVNTHFSRVFGKYQQQENIHYKTTKGDELVGSLLSSVKDEPAHNGSYQSDPHYPRSKEVKLP